MSICERLAAYVWRASWDTISPEARGKLKQHILDAFGCTLGGLSTPFKTAIDLGGARGQTLGECALIGGGRTTVERAAFHNTALVGALEFADTFLADGETCSPAENMPGILAAAELAGASGRDFITALAIAYNVQCRLTASGALIERRGFSNTLQLAISLACGMSRALRLTEKQTAHAIALCASAGVRLSDKPGQTSMAAASTAFECIHAVQLAQKGMTGRLDVIEGPCGVEEILGKAFGIDWDLEDYDGILACSTKRYAAEFHAQSAIEALLELQREEGFSAADVEGVQVDIFQAAYQSLGGNKPVHTHEQASSSLRYLLAVALLDGNVGPEQMDEARVQREDVQSLLPKVTSWLSQAYTRAYPNAVVCKVRAGLRDGRIFEREKNDYLGFFRRPAPVETVLEKYKSLGSRTGEPQMVQNVIQAIAQLEQHSVRELCGAFEEMTAVAQPLEPARVQAVHA